MALFESYERRIDKINSVLNSYGIASIEEAEKITKRRRSERLRSDQRNSADLLRERLLGLHSRCSDRNQKKAAEEPLTQQQLLEKAFRHSVSRDPLQTHVK